MSELPAALKGRVPTLTEVLDAPEMPDLGDEPPLRMPVEQARPVISDSCGFAPGGHAHDTSHAQALDGSEGLMESVMACLAPQVEALVSSRLRDVLAPAIQDAVDEAIERCRQPLVEALERQLREQLSLALSRPSAYAVPASDEAAVTAGMSSGTSSDTPPQTTGLRFP